MQLIDQQLMQLMAPTSLSLPRTDQRSSRFPAMTALPAALPLTIFLAMTVMTPSLAVTEVISSAVAQVMMNLKAVLATIS